MTAITVIAAMTTKRSLVALAARMNTGAAGRATVLRVAERRHAGLLQRGRTVIARP